MSKWKKLLYLCKHRFHGPSRNRHQASQNQKLNLKGCRDKGPNISQTNITERSVRSLHCCFKLVYLHRGRLGGWRWWSGTDETAECRCCHRLGRAPSAMALLGASVIVGQSPFPPFPVTADVGRHGTAWSHMPGCEVALFKRVTTKWRLWFLLSDARVWRYTFVHLVDLSSCSSRLSLTIFVHFWPNSVLQYNASNTTSPSMCP